MRVIGGTLGGRRLETPSDYSVRPTTDKVKEALFSSIQFEIEGASILDLFSGSGQLGIEALSRGAKSAVFVDKSAQSVELTKRNLEKCKLKAQVIKGDSIAFIENCNDYFDIAFLDPPYSTGLLEQALPAVSRRMNKSGVIVAECPIEDELPEILEEGFVLVKQKKYGKLRLNYYRYGN